MNSNFEDADADSSTEDLLVVTRNAAPSLHKDTIDLFSESVPDDSNLNHSDGESEYFSSEETEPHVQATGEQATEVIKYRISQPLNASKQDALDRKNKISLRDTSSQSISNTELSCQAATDASVATINNATNPVNPSSAVLDWNYILTSGVPCNTFETSDAGSLFCLPCSTSYADFASFETHFHARHAHLLQVHTPASADPAARRRTEPPPLVRTEDEAVDPPANTQASTSRRPVQVYFPRRHHPKPSFLCKQCNLDYTNLPALQRHKASLPDRHPHYCSTCTTKYRDTEDFQSVGDNNW